LWFDEKMVCIESLMPPKIASEPISETNRRFIFIAWWSLFSKLVFLKTKRMIPMTISHRKRQKYSIFDPSEFIVGMQCNPVVYKSVVLKCHLVNSHTLSKIQKKIMNAAVWTRGSLETLSCFIEEWTTTNGPDCQMSSIGVLQIPAKQCVLRPK
jgi:hypothetical protein